MRYAWYFAPIFLGVSLASIQGEVKITVFIDGKPQKESVQHLILRSGQSLTLNCFFTCKDDDASKCAGLVWKRSSRDSSERKTMKSKYKTSLTVDSRHRMNSTLSLTANFSMVGVYTCTAAASWESRVMVDLVEVIAGGDVTLPTTLSEQKVSKIPFDKRVVNQTDSLTLTCNVTTSAPINLRTHYWKFKGATLKKGKKYSIVEEVKAKTSTLSLKIENPGIESIGEYQCGVSIAVGKTDSSRVNIRSPPIINMLKEDVSLRQKQGEPFKLRCRVSIWPVGNLTIVWYKNDIGNVANGDGITKKLTESKENATVDSFLIFDALRVEHRGVYFCRATDGVGNMDTMGWYLRVLDPLAPIWPLIGIVFEVIIVIIIIVVYEINQRKRRRAKKLAEAEHAAAQMTIGEADMVDKAESSGHTRQRPAKV